MPALFHERGDASEARPRRRAPRAIRTRTAVEVVVDRRGRRMPAAGATGVVVRCRRRPTFSPLLRESLTCGRHPGRPRSPDDDDVSRQAVVDAFFIVALLWARLREKDSPTRRMLPSHFASCGGDRTAWRLISPVEPHSREVSILHGRCAVGDDHESWSSSASWPRPESISWPTPGS